jgi:hypothetical protein
VASIDAWLYINLDARADRREHLAAQLRAVGALPSPRAPRAGVWCTDGAPVGCSLAHAAALALAVAHPEWRRIAILEVRPCVALPCEAQAPRWARALHALGTFDVLIGAPNVLNLRVEPLPPTALASRAGGG